MRREETPGYVNVLYAEKQGGKKPMEANQLMTETAKTQEIISLHKQIEGHLRLSLDKAIRG